MKYINEKNLYLDNKLSKDQWQIVQKAAQKYSEEEQLEMAINQANQIYQTTLLSERFDAIDRKYKRKIIFRRVIIAVSFLFLLSAGYYFYVNQSKVEVIDNKEIEKNEDIIIKNNSKSDDQIEVEKIETDIKKSDLKPEPELPNKPVIEPDDNIKIFALKRKPIKEGYSFGGNSDEIEFLFHFNKKSHLVDFPIISAAFLEGTLEGGDYKEAKNLLNQELLVDPTNEELQFFRVVIHLLSKQNIKPNDQLKKLNQLRSNHDLEWCKAYLYYSSRQKDKLIEMHTKLQSTTYKEEVNQLLTDIEK